MEEMLITKLVEIAMKDTGVLFVVVATGAGVHRFMIKPLLETVKDIKTSIDGISVALASHKDATKDSFHQVDANINQVKLSINDLNHRMERVEEKVTH